MGLCPDFEGLYGALIHHSPLLFVYVAVNELIAEETHLTTMAYSKAPPSSVGVAASSAPVQILGKPKSRVTLDDCHYCREKGDWKKNCPQLSGSGFPPKVHGRGLSMQNFRGS